MHNKNTRLAVAAALFAATAAALVGCATGKKIEQAQYEQAIEGKTTRSQLVALFGEPTAVSMNGSDEILSYHFMQTSAITYLPFAYLAGGGSTSGQDCYFTFNKQAVLRTKMCSSVKV